MFKSLEPLAKELHVETLELYWILLTPLVLVLIIFEFLKSQRDQIDVYEILRRVVISMVLLITFDYTINVLAMLGDGIIARIDRLEDFWSTVGSLGPKIDEEKVGFFDLRANVLYLLGLLSYIIAYLGFFAAEAITHYVWLILYILSPLMILAYVPKATANVTKSLYKGLAKVIVWKVLWSILGVLLLKMTANPPIGTLEEDVVAIVMNLCVGLSMLFIPIFTRSLLNDGLETAASAFATAPALVAAKSAKLYASKFATKSGSSLLSGTKFASRPVTNPITSRYENTKKNIAPKVKRAARWYSNLNKVKPTKK